MSKRKGPAPRRAIVRFVSKIEIDPENGCWLWTGARTNVGYGNFAADGHRARGAHRFAYEHFVGPIPQGLVLDHLCRVRHCVNPDHLEPVTHGTNLLRGVGASALNAVKTHCNHGHEFTPENTIRCGPDRCWRTCRTCHNARRRITDSVA